MSLYFAYIYPKKNLMEVACKEVSKVFLSAGKTVLEPNKGMEAGVQLAPVEMEAGVQLEQEEVEECVFCYHELSHPIA